MTAARGRPTKRRRYAPPAPPQRAPAVSPAAAAEAAEAEAAIRVLEVGASVASAELSATLQGAEHRALEGAEAEEEEEAMEGYEGEEGGEEEEDAGAEWLAQVEALDSLLARLRERRKAVEAPWDEEVGGGFGRGSVGPPKRAGPEEGLGVALAVERMAQAAVCADIGELILLSQHKRRLLQFAAGSGYTPMTTAARRGFFEMVRFLLDARVPVNLVRLVSCRLV